MRINFTEMSIIVDKKLILNDIMNHLGIKKKSDFAKFLGIATTTLSSWYARNTFNKDLIYSKCEFLNPNWLLTGEGEMLKEKTTTEENLKKENILGSFGLLEENVKLLKENNELLKQIVELTNRIRLLEDELRNSGKDQAIEEAI